MTSGPDPLRRLAPVVRLAPAKLNLTLAVVGRRPDGFHDLHSVMVTLALADRLSVAVAPSAPTDMLHRTGFDAGPIEDDIALRAVALTRAAVPRPPFGADPTPSLALRLEKRIPVAAGLGGGSSDAAAALDGALEAWAVALPATERAALAARLGSDVPFFLAGGVALVEGRGERVAPLPWLRTGTAPGVLLVTPPVAIATPAVFAAYAAGHRVAGGTARLASTHLAEELRGGLGARELLARASVLAAANDLAAAAAVIEPALVPFRRGLRRVLGRPVAQSGSGPTHWALYASLEEAESAGAAVRAASRAGTLLVPGGGEPFVAATTIVTPTPETGTREEGSAR